MCLDFVQASRLVLALRKNSEYHFNPLLFIYADFIWQVCSENWEKHGQQNINRERPVSTLRF